ncbi:MAG: hypothetical protein IT308_10155 [Anaerolineaceae bacterium]|nr:hypothetical protein [Anaerolineaceae bacterium]
METPVLSAEQNELIKMPLSGSLFLEGTAGSGKTTTALGRYLYMLQEGVPPESILLLAPQRTLLQPYVQATQWVEAPPGSVAVPATVGGLARRLTALFWPLIAAQAGFKKPEQPPIFLTLETAQYYMARLVRPLIEKGYFNTITIDRNRLYSQIIDNLNKAAGAGFPHTQIADRLKSAWVGEPVQQHIYEEAQECANLFRTYCLENNLLDFSLQVEIFTQLLWPDPLCQRYLIEEHRHLIYDNIEEDIPVFQDIIRKWLPGFDSAWLIYNLGGGYRTFLGADRMNGYALREVCGSRTTLETSWIALPSVAALRDSLLESIVTPEASHPNPLLMDAVKVVYRNFYPEVIEAVCQEVFSLVEKQVSPGEIVILAPFISDSLRFAVMSRLQSLGVPVQSHRPSRSLRDEPAVNCLLTLAKIAHPDWEISAALPEIRQALMVCIQDLDLVRADLLARICFRPSRWREGFSSFDRIQLEMQERIGFWVGERFERIRRWLEEYQVGEQQELDIFLSRIFGELLSQPGFGFHTNLDSAAVTARLIESVQKFRQVVGVTLSAESRAIGREYIHMVEDGVVAAQYLQSWDTTTSDAVLIAPAYTFLMSNRNAAYQFWLDIGSLGWWERLYQPLTHPVVLSRRWPSGNVWTDIDEQNENMESLTRLVSGLTTRCSQGIYLCTSRIDQQGDEPRGKLLRAIQSILRRLPNPTEVALV